MRDMIMTRMPSDIPSSSLPPSEQDQDTIDKHISLSMLQNPNKATNGSSTNPTVGKGGLSTTHVDPSTVGMTILCFQHRRVKDVGTILRYFQFFNFLFLVTFPVAQGNVLTYDEFELVISCSFYTSCYTKC